MEEMKKQQAPKVQILSNDMEKQLEKLGKSPVPDIYKVPREVGRQITARQLELFEEYIEPDMTPDGTVIRAISVDKVKEYHFRIFTQAASQILYNQSVQSGHHDTNTGMEENVAEEYSMILSQVTGTYEVKYGGTIFVSLYEICQKAYGTKDPTTRQKRDMQELIANLDTVKLEYKAPNGDVLKRKMCSVMEEYIRQKDGAHFYRIFLHPIFCEQLENNFSAHPQDIMARLNKVVERVTSPHMILLQYLGLQDKRKPCTMTAENFLNRMGMKASFKKNKKRTMEQVERLCKAMVDVGMATKYTINPPTGKTFKEVIFILNPYYVKSPEKQIPK